MDVHWWTRWRRDILRLRSGQASQKLMVDSPSFAPQKAIWLEDKLPWVVIDEPLPSFPKTLQT
jgi:hypothetical protein